MVNSLKITYIQYMIAPITETKEYSIVIDNSYIKLIDQRSDQVVELNEIDEMIADVEKHRKSEKIPLIIVTGFGTMLTNEARERLTHLAKSKTYKIAIIIHDFTQRIMGNFVIHLLNNRRSLQLFTNETDAKKWLLDI